jgi:hypothetical protein
MIFYKDEIILFNWGNLIIISQIKKKLTYQ